MSGKLRQLYTALACAFSSLVMGSLNVWPSYTASIYTSNMTTPLAEPMSRAEESLLGSLPSLGAMAGTAIGGPAINMLGRKHGSLVLTLPAVISWALISVSSNTMMILISRFIAGISGGATLVTSPIFISEVAEDSIRGALASMPVFMYCLGAVMSNIMGWFLTYRTIIWMNVVIATLCALLTWMVVESPIFLVRQKRDEDARLAISKYRGVSVSSSTVSDELSRLKQQIAPSVELVAVTDPDTKLNDTEKEKLNIDNVIPVKAQSISPLKLLFVSPSSRFAFFIIFTIITLQVLMGIVPVQVYAKTVFQQTDPSRADMYTVIFALTLLSGCGVTTLVADKAGRRVLQLTSTVLVGVCMVSLGFLIGSKNVPPLVTVGLILAYCFFFMLGAGSIPYVLLAEVFVLEVQSIASMIIVEWVWFLNFVIIAVFPYMVSALGTGGTFFLFAGTSAANAIVSYFIVPETKGLSNMQIQDLLARRRK